MKQILAAIVGVTFVVMPMLARAEQPDAPFSGAYVGINAGAAWGSFSYATDPNCSTDAFGGTFCNTAPNVSAINGTTVANSGTGELSPDGFTGGGQLGYNWQTGSIVYGGEADFGALNFSESINASGTFPSTFLGDSYTLSETMSTDWLATIRGRIGVTVRPHVLVYATGGFAFTDLKVSSTYSDNAVGAGFPGGTGYGSESRVRTGWTLGGGGEWLLDGFWSVKLEYLYTDFGSVNVAVPTSNTAAFAQTMQVEADLNAHIARIGLNYRY